MSRPTDWSPLALHTDPIPGDPMVVAAYGTKYQDVADAITRTAAKLTAIANHDDAQISQYVDKLRDKVGDVATDITKAHERYAGVAAAMTNYAGPLERAQTMADAALTKARGASDQIEQANSLHHHYQQQLNDPSVTPDDQTKYTQLQNANAQTLSEAQGALHAAQQDLQAAITLRNQAASTASDAIKDVQSSGGLNDSGWTKFWEHHGKFIADLVTKFGQFAAALAIIGLLIPGLGEVILAVIAIIGIIAAVLTIVNAVCQMTAGTEPIGQGIFEIVMALVPFGVARVAGKFATAAEPAIEDAAAVTMRTSKAAQGIKGVTQTKAAEQVTENLAGVKPGLADTLMTGRSSALKLAKIQELGKMDLVKGGVSGRIAGMAKTAHLTYVIPQLVEPTLNVTGTESRIGESIGASQEPQEMVESNGR